MPAVAVSQTNSSHMPRARAGSGRARALGAACRDLARSDPVGQRRGVSVAALSPARPVRRAVLSRASPERPASPCVAVCALSTWHARVCGTARPRKSQCSESACAAARQTASEQARAAARRRATGRRAGLRRRARARAAHAAHAPAASSLGARKRRPTRYLYLICMPVFSLFFCGYLETALAAAAACGSGHLSRSALRTTMASVARASQHYHVPRGGSWGFAARLLGGVGLFVRRLLK